MIPRKELEAVGRSLGFNAYQAEKDYLQHALLSSLYAVSKNEFVFKGGTALQKGFGLDRFSEDLDFTFAGRGDAGRFVELAGEDLRKSIEAGISKKEKKDNSFSARVKAQGPLYDGTERSVQTVVIEVSLRETVLDAPTARRIVPPYADLRPYVALCMSLDEMLAEKVRAILTREKPRDVYDAWFLIRRDAVFRKEMADAKLSYYGQKFGFAKFERAVRGKRKLWEKEMGVLVRSVPTFRETCDELLQALKRHGE